MGAGLALQAKSHYPGIQVSYMQALRTMEDKGDPWDARHCSCLILAPTKRHWRDKSSMADLEVLLIKLSNLEGGPFAIPEMGCGLGGLKWEDTKHLYDVFNYVDTEWVIVHPC